MKKRPGDTSRRKICRIAMRIRIRKETPGRVQNAMKHSANLDVAKSAFATPSPYDGQQTAQWEERRRARRLSGPLHAIVRGVVAGEDQELPGPRFSVVATACDVSATGLSLVLEHPLTVGARLFVVFSFAGNWSRVGKPLPRIAALAVVRHVHPLSGTTYRVGVELTRHRLLDSSSLPVAAPPVAPPVTRPVATVVSPPLRRRSGGSVVAGLAVGRPSLLQLAWDVREE